MQTDKTEAKMKIVSLFDGGQKPPPYRIAQHSTPKSNNREENYLSCLPPGGRGTTKWWKEQAGTKAEKRSSAENRETAGEAMPFVANGIAPPLP